MAKLETPPTPQPEPASPQPKPAAAPAEPSPTAEEPAAKEFAGLQGWGAPKKAEPAPEPPEVSEPEPPAAPAFEEPLATDPFAEPAAAAADSEAPAFEHPAETTPFAEPPAGEVDAPAFEHPAGTSPFADAPAFEDPWAPAEAAPGDEAPAFPHAAGTNPFADPPAEGADAPAFPHAAGTNPFAAAPAFEDPWAADPFAQPAATGEAQAAEAPAFVDPWAPDAAAETAPPATQQPEEAGSSFGFLELLDMEQSGQRAIVDVNARALAVLVHRDGQPRARVMIPGNSPLPVTAKNVFHTYFDNQPGVRVVVLEGDSEDPDECARVGECLIMGLPLRPKGQAIEILYAYDTNGRISVHARDVESGVQARVEFQR